MIKKKNSNLEMKTSAFVFFLFLSTAIIIIDQLTKIAALKHFAAYPVSLFKEKIFLSFYLNDGLAFSLPAPFWLTLLVLPVGLFLLIRYYQKQYQVLPTHQSRSGGTVRGFALRIPKNADAPSVSSRSASPFFGLVLLFTGGVSNLIDRFVYGKVIDFVEISGVSIFNLADIMIVCGATFLLLEELVFGFRREK